MRARRLEPSAAKPFKPNSGGLDRRVSWLSRNTGFTPASSLRFTKVAIGICSIPSSSQAFRLRSGWWEEHPPDRETTFSGPSVSSPDEASAGPARIGFALRLLDLRRCPPHSGRLRSPCPRETVPEVRRVRRTRWPAQSPRHSRAAPRPDPGSWMCGCEPRLQALLERGRPEKRSRRTACSCRSRSARSAHGTCRETRPRYRRQR